MVSCDEAADPLVYKIQIDSKDAGAFVSPSTNSSECALRLLHPGESALRSADLSTMKEESFISVVNGRIERGGTLSNQDMIDIDRAG